MPRALVAAAVVLIALVGGGLWWVSHLQAIEFAGTGGGGSLMKTLPSLDADEYESDPPPTYAWHTYEKISFTWEFHNSLSIPITITGRTRTAWAARTSSPPQRSTSQNPESATHNQRRWVSRFTRSPFPQTVPKHHDHLAHAGYLRPASRFGPDGSQQFSAIHLRYTVLGLFHSHSGSTSTSPTTRSITSTCSA